MVSSHSTRVSALANKSIGIAFCPFVLLLITVCIGGDSGRELWHKQASELHGIVFITERVDLH